MTREDIIRMAHEAGVGSDEEYGFSERELLKFAALIAEDCAKRCEEESDAFREGGWNAPAAGAGTCADAIREAYKP
jgi:hypothetical protein